MVRGVLGALRAAGDHRNSLVRATESSPLQEPLLLRLLPTPSRTSWGSDQMKYFLF